MKRLGREQATPQARTGVYCLINMMLGKVVLFPKLDSAKVGFGTADQESVFSGSYTPLRVGRSRRQSCMWPFSRVLGAYNLRIRGNHERI
jgi:hypothetical protein